MSSKRSDLASTSLRLGLRATRTTLKLTGKLAGAAIQAGRKRAAKSSGSAATATPDAPTAASTAPATPPEAPTTPPATPAAAAPEPVTAPSEAPSTPLVPHDAYVKTESDEDAVVGESADFGAKDGAGAQLDLAEPWEGYAAANAPDIIAKIADLDAAQIALLELYEQSHKARKTVLAAATRRLEWLNPPRAA